MDKNNEEFQKINEELKLIKKDLNEEEFKKINEELENIELVKKDKIMIKMNNRVEPLEWVQVYKKEFPNWIYSTFHNYQLEPDNKTSIKKNKFEPFKYQEFLRDYLQENSPYRGVLLYHGLGSGKTCTAITIAENLKNDRNIVVLLPASLKNNFIEQGLLYCGDPLYQKDIDLLEQKYDFVSYNASNSLEQLQSIGSLDSKVIIIEEAHNFISKLKSGINGGSKHGFEMYQMLMNAKDLKIIALSGTPIINDPFELAVLFNVLRGYIEVTNYRILNVDDDFNWNDYEDQLRKLEYIDYVGINKINKSIEFHITVKSYSNQYSNVLENIEEISNLNNIEVKYLNLMNYTLFETNDDGDEFYHNFIQIDEKYGDRIKNDIIFKRRISGLVSYYVAQKKDYPETIIHDDVRVLMSQYQKDIYQLLREQEKKTEKSKGSSTKGKKKKLSTTVQSMFRVYSRQACNFVFPDSIPRPYKNPKFQIQLKKKNKDLNLDLNTLNDELDEEKISQEYKERQQKALLELKQESDKYLTLDALDTYSPKMKAIYENIEKSEGPVFIYSDFRNMEGVEIFKLILEQNGYSLYSQKNDKPKYAIYSGSEDYETKKDIIKTFNDLKNSHGDVIKIILSTRAGVEGLDLKYIRQVHIIEPYWNNNRIKQAIGRAVRRGSHADLPPKERKVDVFKYISILNELDLNQKRGEQLSTDEYINKIAKNKDRLIDDLTVLLKEASIDCMLNKLVIDEDYECLSYGNNASGIAYNPKLTKNIIGSDYKEDTKIVEKKIVPGVLDDKKNIYLMDKEKKILYFYNDEEKKKKKVDKKNIKKIGIEKMSGKVYDINSIKKGKPILLGKIKGHKMI